jgi:hypothetical protein
MQVVFSWLPGFLLTPSERYNERDTPNYGFFPDWASVKQRKLMEQETMKPGTRLGH